tara:strand:- start:827 stop:1300 length:474 start_codon:yes stop_codon:yes gene_type:complete
MNSTGNNEPKLSLMHCDNRDHIQQKMIQLDQEQMDYKWESKTWKEILDKPYFEYWTLMSGQELIGFALYQLLPDGCAHLLKILVAEKFRNRGMADKIFSHSKQELSKRGMVSLYLEVAQDNEKAINLYLKHGLKILNIKKRFYSDGKNACAMQLKLN